MAKRSSTKIADFVEARREVVALKRQLVEYPELKTSPQWLTDFNQAKVKADLLYRDLRGGELAQVKVILNGEGLL